jgi:hypothetical protein
VSSIAKNNTVETRVAIVEDILSKARCRLRETLRLVPIDTLVIPLWKLLVPLGRQCIIEACDSISSEAQGRIPVSRSMSQVKGSDTR